MHKNSLAIKAFLKDHAIAWGTHAEWLYIRKGKLKFNNRVSYVTLFLAKLGFGNASMYKIAKFINDNQDTCFADNKSKKDFSDFINGYNITHFRKIKLNLTINDDPDDSPDNLSGAAVDSSIPNIGHDKFWSGIGLDPTEETTAPLKPGKEEIDADGLKATDVKKERIALFPVERQAAHDNIKSCYNNCLLAFDNLNKHKSKKELAKLLANCNLLTESLESWKSIPYDAEDPSSKEEKQTLNNVLIFRDQVRAALYPKKEKPLRGGHPSKTINLPPAANTELDKLKNVLKGIRLHVLTRYFKERLEFDEAKLNLLVGRFSDINHKFTLEEQKFLENLLDYWQERLAKGKPIAIPKWFHCTKTVGIVGKILDSFILYMHQGGYPGSFVSTQPEIGAEYGDYCLMLSEMIEKTGTKEKKGIPTVFPKYTNFDNPQYAVYSDAPVPVEDFNQIRPKIWVGYQRGAETLDKITKIGTDGIPLRRKDRVQKGGLKYRKDTSLAFVYHINDDPNLNKTASERRVKVITRSQAEALIKLINWSFALSIPESWENNFQHG